MRIATRQSITGNARAMRDLFLHFALVGSVASLATFMAQEADARGRGGGIRGAGVSVPRGGGLGRPQSLQRPSGQRPALGKSQRPAGSGAASANTGVAGNRQGNTGVVGNGNGITGIAGNRNGNMGVVGNGNGNTGVVNNGNVVAGNNVDVNVDNGPAAGWDGDYPVGAAYATGVAVGATTAAVVGSYYSSLPAGCSPYTWSGLHYYSCGNSWYQRTYSDGSTVYVVVSDPRK